MRVSIPHFKRRRSSLPAPLPHCRWILLDSQGFIHAVLTAANRDRALFIAGIAFPEMTTELLPWDQATARQRAMAAQAIPLSIDFLKTRGLVVEFADTARSARLLQKHFPHTAALGGAR